MIIDCKDCEMYQTQHCDDCFVMAVLTRRGEEPLELEEEESQAMKSLQEAGLAPILKFRQKAG